MLIELHTWSAGGRCQVCYGFARFASCFLAVLGRILLSMHVTFRCETGISK
jgi:hypothetical protein